MAKEKTETTVTLQPTTEPSNELKSLLRKTRVQYRLYKQTGNVEDGITWATYMIYYRDLLLKEMNIELSGPKLWEACQ